MVATRLQFPAVLRACLRFAVYAMTACALPAFAQEQKPLPAPQAPAQVFETVILVAAPELSDPNFARSVVLVTQTPVGELLGLVLNRPTALPWPRGVVPPAQAEGKRLNFGGPLIPAATFAVGTSSTAVADTQDLGGGLRFAVGLKNSIALAAAGGGSASLKLFRGYAGWGPGQLEAEVAAGAWQLRAVTPEVIFDPAPDTQWERLVAPAHAVRMLPAPPAWPYSAGLDLRNSMRLMELTWMSRTSVPCSTLSGTAVPAWPRAHSFL